jgi:hypothetical protein
VEHSFFHDLTTLCHQFIPFIRSSFTGLESYNLTVAGVAVIEDNNLGYNTTSQDDLAIDVSAETGADGAVVYSLVAGRRSTGEKSTAQRKFSACDQLDMFCRSAISKENHHLRTSLPAFPPKYLKQLLDHSAPEFIERRRDELERYFKKLVQFPRMERNPDLNEFLGLSTPPQTPPAGVVLLAAPGSLFGSNAASSGQAVAAPQLQVAPAPTQSVTTLPLPVPPLPVAQPADQPHPTGGAITEEL